MGNKSRKLFEINFWGVNFQTRIGSFLSFFFFFTSFSAYYLYNKYPSQKWRKIPNFNVFCCDNSFFFLLKILQAKSKKDCMEIVLDSGKKHNLMADSPILNTIWYNRINRKLQELRYISTVRLFFFFFFEGVQGISLACISYSPLISLLFFGGGGCVD